MSGSIDCQYPVEITFPSGLSQEERERINDELTKTVEKLGYRTDWIPVL
jgi:hypothetical protein